MTPNTKIIMGALLLAAMSGSGFAQTRIPASFAAPPGSVNTSAPGFKARIHQIGVTRTPGDANSVENAERQLANGYVDDATGEPLANEADLSAAGTDGMFVIPDVINWNQDSTPDNPTGGNAGNFRPDAPIPGIPGVNGSTDNIAAEILTFLELPAGTNTFGVNSDDGFKMTVGVGTNPKNAFAQRVGLFSGGRGSADSIFTFVVEQAGIYPARLAWWEGNGGANVEWFTITPTGERILVNDRSNPNAVKAYREAAAGAAGPYALSVSPAPGSTGVAPEPRIVIELADQSTQVNQSSIQLTFNNSAATPAVSKSGNITTIRFTPTGTLAPGSTNEAVLVFADTGGTRQTNRLQFTVQNYYTIPAANAYPLGSGGEPGFRVRTAQNTPAVGTLPNTIQRAEAQLAGTLINRETGAPFANEAIPGPNPDGSYNDPDVINFDEAQTDRGNFNSTSTPAFPEEAVPGIPGTGASTDNYAVEIITFLELSAGMHTFGVNSDDGFVLYTGADARDVFAQPVGRFDGGRGSSDSIFSFVAETSGIYSFRLVYYEGNGDSNIEFFSVDPDSGQRILINDRNNPKGIKAYRTITAPARAYVRSATPAPNEGGVALNSNIQLELVEGATAIQNSSIELLLNGQAVSPTVTDAGNVTTISFNPATDFESFTTNRVTLVYTEEAERRTNQLSFTTFRVPKNLPPFQEANGLVVFEAENFHTNVAGATHEWEFENAYAGFVADGYMRSLPDTGANENEVPGFSQTSPHLDFRVNFTSAGTYYIWIRATDAGSGGDSVHVGMDGQEFESSDRITGFGNANYVWARARQSPSTGTPLLEVPSAGEHVINVYMREDGAYFDRLLLTRDAGYVPSGAGPAESRRVGQAPPPSVSITAPAAGANFSANGNITITANATDSDGTISRVEFFANGTKIGEATSAPYTVTFANVAQGRYTLTARVTDNTGDTSVTDVPVAITVGNLKPLAVFVVGNPGLNASDAAIRTRLEALGFEVRVVDDNLSATSDASGAALVVTSSTSDSNQVLTKFRDVAVPVVNWEQALQDNYGFTTDEADVTRGGLGSQTEINIVKSDHPLAAGLPTGPLTIAADPANPVGTTWGVPAPSAIIIGTVAGDPSQANYYGFEAGATMIGGVVAPARRVHLFLDNDTFAGLSENARKLVDAAFTWAANLSTQEPQPEFTMVSAGDGNMSFSWTGEGTLQEATMITGPWTTAASQANPQTVPTTGQARFFRIRR